MAFTVASFNLQNLISPGQSFYHHDGLSEADFAWKLDWLSDQLLALDADVVAMQEVFDEPALDALIARTDEKGSAARPGRYAGTLRRSGRHRPYGAGRVFAPNINGSESNPRPGLAVVSRLPIRSADAVQDIAHAPLETEFMQLGHRLAGEWRLNRLSRPFQRVEIEAEGRRVALFNAHLKSPSPEFHHGGAEAPEQDLLAYDAIGRGMGHLRANLRRMGEALALRRAILADLEAGLPVVAAGDMNGPEEGDAARLLAGERPQASYAGEPKPGGGVWSPAEDRAIRARIEALRLESAEAVFSARTGGAGFHTAAFDGVYRSLDRILLSHQFRDGAPGQIGRLEHLRVFNDHLNDGALPVGPEDALASDHGQIVARLAWL